MAGNRLLHGPRVLFLTAVVSVCFFAVFVISIVEFSSSRPTDRPTDWTEALCGRAREREGERGRKREGKRGTRGKDRKERGGERERIEAAGRPRARSSGTGGPRGGRGSAFRAVPVTAVTWSPISLPSPRHGFPTKEGEYQPEVRWGRRRKEAR